MRVVLSSGGANTTTLTATFGSEQREKQLVSNVFDSHQRWIIWFPYFFLVDNEIFANSFVHVLAV